MNPLIIGLGNPILGDDGVGWVVAHEVERVLPGINLKAEVDCLSLGGLSLMERMIGYQDVILIDSLNTGMREQGSVVAFSLDEMVDLIYGHSSAAHDASLKHSLEVGRRLGAILPSDNCVHVVAIEAKHIYDFTEELTLEIGAAVPVAVKMVMDLVKKINTKLG